MTPPVVRVVGPPGSGKSLLIATLVEALRAHGRRTASVELRDAGHTGGRAVVTLASGGRVAPERPLAAGELDAFVAGLDPSADLVLAEGYEEPGTPAIEITAEGEPPLAAPADRLAAVTREELAASFAAHGPAAGRDLAALIDERLLGGGETARGLLGRLRNLGRR